MALLTSPGAMPGGPAIPGLALGREEGGFDMVLDQVVAQIAALLAPATPPVTPELTAPTLPGLPTVGFAPSEAAEGAPAAPDHTHLVAPHATDALVDAPGPAMKAAPMAIPTFVPVAAVAPQPVLADAPIVTRESPATRSEETEPTADSPGPADALIAAIRVGLGLPTSAPISVAPVPATPGDKKPLPEQAVAVGRTGVMPALPEHAQATLPTPTGIARKFPTAPLAPSEKAESGETSIRLLRSGDSVVEAAPFEAAPVEAAPVEAAPLDVVVPAPVEVAAEPVNDIAVPDVPVSGVEVSETPADDAPVPVPRFDDAPRTEMERLNAIAPPKVSIAEDATDKNDTTDTLVTTHDDDAPPQVANAVTDSSRVSRPERADRPERAHEANGLAAPLRTALRDRAASRRDDSFELTVRLDPPELGAVRVRVFTQGDNVKITMHADSPEARAVLQQRQDDVRDILRNEGFNLDGFDVETNDDRHREPEQSNRRRSSAPAPRFEEQPVDDGALRL